MKNSFYCWVCIFFISLFLLQSCSPPVETSDLTKTYRASEMVHSESYLSVVFQNIVSAPSLRIPTSITNIRQFPFTYLQVEGNPMKIIKITRDGNTLDLLIDKPNVKTAYIIEEPENISDLPANTNASYMVNRYSAEMKPVDPHFNIAMVSLSLQNRTRKKVLLEDVSIYFYDENGTQYPIDRYISESLMTCDYPTFLKKDEVTPLRFLGLLPSDLEKCFLHVDGLSFEWTMDSSEGA
ncbi:MAG TPA: hypothetical protein PLE09_00120 [Caldisericia bacterium]|nr:hypothetical protein [Caldisericia bacterium]HXK50942.1 hypothetical protein [Caldisericia bacterium]